MDSAKIEEKDIHVGKWYWLIHMDRPVCLVGISEKDGRPMVSIPTLSLVRGGDAPPHGSGYFFQKKVEWNDLADVKISPTPLDF